MTEKVRVRFEEAERRKGIIFAAIITTCTILSWFGRESKVAMAGIAVLATYLMTGNRYQWLYIWKKTFYRDMIGFRVLVTMIIKIWLWERRGVTVVTRWADVAKRNPEKKAFVMGDRSLTFREIRQTKEVRHSVHSDGRIVSVNKYK